MTWTLAAVFQPASAGHWYLDLTGAARMLLEQHGVGGVYAGDICTYTKPGRFFSHRRDGLTGRMATCIWLEQATRSEGGVALARWNAAGYSINYRRAADRSWATRPLAKDASFPFVAFSPRLARFGPDRIAECEYFTEPCW